MTVVTGQPKQKLVIYGAGGHGRVVADAASVAGFEILGFLDDGLPVGSPILGWQVLGNLDWLDGKAAVAIAHGVGSNAVRERVTRALSTRGISLAKVVHPSAVLSRYALVGDGAVSGIL